MNHPYPEAFDLTDAIDSLPAAPIVRRKSDRVIVRCPFCRTAHAHGALSGEFIGPRVSHCSTSSLIKAGAEAARWRDSLGRMYRPTHVDGTPA